MTRNISFAQRKVSEWNGERNLKCLKVWSDGFEVMGKITGGMKMSRKTMVRCLAAILIALCAMAGAVAQMPNPYGMPISLENARKAAAPAMAEAAKNNWTIAVAIVDPGGNLVYYEKMDNTQLGSATVAIDKARSAALFKRPTKALQDALAAGGDGLRILRLQGAVPVEGGIPLLMDGKIVGAIGVSGGTTAQDGQCAKAGADTVK
jgi:glc operon protein GlcG